MVHRVVWRVADEDALDFWEQRLRDEGVEAEREPGRLRFEDPEGLGLELAVVQTPDRPLISHHPDVPGEAALQGFDGVRAYTRDPLASNGFLADSLGFQSPDGETYEARGEGGSFYAYDRTDEPGLPGAGTVHHVAWSSPIEDHEAWRDRVMAGGAMPTPVIDRFYFKSIYFREPSGVLFEIATIGPGFTSDEPLESLGERLSLPPNFEQYREQVEGPDAAARSPREDAGVVSLEHLLRPATDDPEGALVLFHGRGTSEHDLYPLLDAFDPARRLLGATPRGPLVLPPGGAHWYVVREIGFPDRETFTASYELAAAWLDGLAEETGIPAARTIIGGFSQGAVMSWALGLGRGRPRPAGIIALSGFVPTVDGFELDLSPPLPPVAIGHGTYDPVISVEFGRQAKRLLEEAGAEVLYRESPMPHSVDPSFIAELQPWVSDVLSRAAEVGSQS